MHEEGELASGTIFLAGFDCFLLEPSLSTMMVSAGSLIMSVGLFMMEVFGKRSREIRDVSGSTSSGSVCTV